MTDDDDGDDDDGDNDADDDLGEINSELNPLNSAPPSDALPPEPEPSAEVIQLEQASMAGAYTQDAKGAVEKLAEADADNPDAGPMLRGLQLMTEPAHREFLGEAWNRISEQMPATARHLFHCIMTLARLNYVRGYRVGQADAIRNRHMFAPPPSDEKAN